jgi:hypothetical protein
VAILAMIVPLGMCHHLREARGPTQGEAQACRQNHGDTRDAYPRFVP